MSLLSTVYLNSCTSPPINICKLQKGNADDRCSTDAYVVLLDDFPISWSSKKQRTVARSSTEAEYKAIANTTAETIWIVNLLEELCFSIPNTPTIYCDNLGATFLCQNLAFTHYEAS
ncbi:hypothetical protein KY289_011697 [Solanum tuberosum]|nr:hypothetical protein KY289_011697 [Solanum tuberosum]